MKVYYLKDDKDGKVIYLAYPQTITIDKFRSLCLMYTKDEDINNLASYLCATHGFRRISKEEAEKTANTESVSEKLIKEEE